MLPKEQIPILKKQIIDQINSTFPEDQKESATDNITHMSDDQFEEFLKQNKLISDDGSTPSQSKCIFCSLVFGDIPSTKIAENEKAIAILELNPISKAHTIIIPKEHIETKETLPEETMTLAKQISEKLMQTFKPKNIITEFSNMFGHEIINIIPVYNNETSQSPKQKSSPEELQKIKDELEEIKLEPKEKTKEKQEEEINEKNTWLPNRKP